MRLLTKSLILALFFTLLGCDSDDNSGVIPVEPVSETPSYYKGMDLSFLPELEGFDVRFKDEDGRLIANNYNYLKDRGVNLVRIRLWVNHEDGRYDLEAFIEQALQAQAAGMEILLDLHYSDTWADPGSQIIPQQWSGLDASAMAITASNYTSTVLQELKSSGIEPAIIQIGNETNNGFLWPLAKVYDNGNENWENYTAISKAISNRIRIVSPEAQIMIHHAGVDGASYFYDQLIARDLDFDIMGLSYYPWWQGTDINSFENDLRSLGNTHLQDIMIVETAYPFTLDREDNLNNVVWNTGQLVAGYPATPSGQRDFMFKLDNILKSLPNDKGLGYCYWAPDWVAFDDADRAFIPGTNWENVTLFDFDNQATPAMDVYSRN